jgi:hypothetical protein
MREVRNVVSSLMCLTEVGGPDDSPIALTEKYPQTVSTIRNGKYTHWAGLETVELVAE